MAAEDQDSRTEDPTAKRRAEAAKKGNVAVSREVGFAVMLVATLAIAILILPWSIRPLLGVLGSFVQHPEQYPLDSRADIVAIGYRVAMGMALALGPAMVLFAASGVLAVFVQHGRFLWAYEKLGVQWDLINPSRGFTRVFSGRALVEWLKGLVKLSLVAVLAFVVLRPEFAKVDLLIGIAPAQLLWNFSALLRKLLFTAVIGIAAIAAADVFYQRWSNWRSLKMTRHEVKDEHKNQDGDPTIKAKYRARRQARARRRMMQAVPKASVVVTNPTHYAVALNYEQGMNAPRLVAKGVDFLAQRIRALAEENGVPIIENPPVARALYAAVDIDDEIPPEHYKAVAEIIGYVMRLGRKRPVHGSASG